MLTPVVWSNAMVYHNFILSQFFTSHFILAFTYFCFKITKIVICFCLFVGVFVSLLDGFFVQFSSTSTNAEWIWNGSIITLLIDSIY